MLKNPNRTPGRWSKWIAILFQNDFDVEEIKKVPDAMIREPHEDMSSNTRMKVVQLKVRL